MKLKWSVGIGLVILAVFFNILCVSGIAQRPQSRQSDVWTSHSRAETALSVKAYGSLKKGVLAADQTAAPASRALEGTWQGALEFGSGQRLRLVLRVSKGENANYSGKLESVDQGTTIPIDLITVNGDDIRLEFKSITGVYEGALNKDRAELNGKWMQGGGPPLALSFKRVEPGEMEEGKTPVSSASPRAPQRPLDAPVDVFVPIAPTPFQASGKVHLVYELRVTNFSRADCLLMRMEVTDGDGKRPLAKYEGNDLAGLLSRPGSSDTDKQKIGPGQHTVVYLWVTLDKSADVPGVLRHRLTFKVGSFPEEMTVECARLTVGQGLGVLDPPLRGGDWLAANGPSNTSVHRRAFVPIGGRAYFAQRFAIDWVRLREGELTFAGNPLDNKNYRAYGSEVLAVSDAIVAGVRDGIPENVPGFSSRAVPITLDTVAGNHVVLDMGNGRYAVYGHLQPGSIRVKAGAKVRRGQVIGLMGNSGNSTEPHLHFHVCDSNSPLACEGLPYVFRSYELQGKGRVPKPGEPNAGGETRRMELPLEKDVVRFPSSP